MMVTTVTTIIVEIPRAANLSPPIFGGTCTWRKSGLSIRAAYKIGEKGECFGCPIFVECKMILHNRPQSSV